MVPRSNPTIVNASNLAGATIPGRIIAILGNAGWGKTHLADAIIDLSATQHNQFSPIFIDELGDMDECQPVAETTKLASANRLVIIASQQPAIIHKILVCMGPERLKWTSVLCGRVTGGAPQLGIQPADVSGLAPFDFVIRNQIILSDHTQGLQRVNV